MKPLYEHYRASRAVYALELPGFGHSERGKRVYSSRMMTDAIHAMVAQIHGRHGGDAIDALAVSLSCEFLARVINEAPSKFRSVALISPTGFSAVPREASKTGRTRAKPWLHAILKQPLWSERLWLLASRRSIRFFWPKPGDQGTSTKVSPTTIIRRRTCRVRSTLRIVSFPATCSAPR